jgi:hypothetical protein
MPSYNSLDRLPQVVQNSSEPGASASGFSLYAWDVDAQFEAISLFENWIEHQARRS